MIDYRTFKLKFFKDLIMTRKKELNYVLARNNDTGDICSKCVYMESFSPYMQRCYLISLDVGNGRSASVSINSKCDEFTEHRTLGRSVELMSKYNDIEYDKLNRRDVLMAHRRECEVLEN